MKPMVVDVERYGSLGGEEVAMTFDENSIAHIMSVLTDLYSDSEMAVLREYATNAYDSHVAAGVSKPIEVTLPTPLNPTLTITDYGVGMSKDDIVNIYSKYGASTKRDTNEQTGTLGLGCKSALTYTSQFKVTAIKDHVKTVVSVSRNVDGTGVMELVSSEYTSDGNGVSISVPVNNVSSMVEKAASFFRFWKTGTVLVDGVAPVAINGVSITDNIILTSSLDHDIIVMGNVPYRVSNQHTIVESSSRWSWKGYGVVAWVPIGTVAFTPNREDLRYTDATTLAIKKLRHEFLKNFNQQLNNAIENAPTAADAVAQFVEFSDKYSSIQGFHLKKEWRGQSFAGIGKMKNVEFHPNRSRNQVVTRGEMDEKRAIDGTFITGFPEIQLTSFYKRKIRALGITDTVRLVHEQTLPDWFAKATIYTWTDVKAVKLGSGSSGRGGNYGRQLFKVLDKRGYFGEQEGLDPDRPIYFDTFADYKEEGRYLNRIFDADSEQIVLISKNRWDKFVRDFPHAKRIFEGRKIKEQEFVDNVPADVVESIMMRHRNVLRGLDESRIDDPDFKRQIIIAKKDCSEWEHKFNVYSHPFKEVDSVLHRYSMVDTWDMSRPKKHAHLYIYINAVYNEIYKNKESQ